MSEARVKDRISALPDGLLHHMLSFLPTKYAVRTGTLSTRWKKLWASVPNLDFEFKSEDKSDCAGFLTFVDRVLCFRDSTDIQKFRLHCSSVGDYSHIDFWIRAAIMRNPVEIDLCLYYRNQTLELPKRLFMGKTLMVLKVNSNCITYNPPTSGFFPSLKILHVIVENHDSDSMEKLFSCCPVLEDLTIAATLGCDEVWNFRVSAPELKTLRITLHRSDTFSTCDSDDGWGCNISTNAPKLENLELKQGNLSSYFWENAQSLVKASVNLDYQDFEEYEYLSDNATALLAGISNVEYLSLSAHFVEPLHVPAFDNLRGLKLVLHNCCDWKFLMELLMRSPNLESLVIEHNKDVDCTGGYSEKEWIPESVPACLVSHLKTITIRGFEGHPHEKGVAKYLFENGSVLKEFSFE